MKITRRSFVQKTTLASIGMLVADSTKATQTPEGVNPVKHCDSVLWYDQPASSFNEALPLGNGRLGAMVYGGTSREKLSLNEDTIWAGVSAPSPSPEAQKALHETRSAIASGDYERAQHIIEEKILTQCNQPYLPAGDLIIERENLGTINGYRRSLDLASGITRSEWTVDGNSFNEECFVSAVDQVIVVRLESKIPSTVRLSLDCQLRNRISPTSSGLDLESEVPVFVGSPSEGVRYASGGEQIPRRHHIGLKVIAPGAEVSTEGSSVQIRNAHEMLIYIAIETTHRSKTPAELVNSRLQQAIQKPFAQVKADHVSDYARLFQRVRLELGSPHEDLSALTTDQRLQRKQSGQPDFALETLLFDYGRYLLISSSRPGSQPANLQGIWNDQLHPPWWSNWTMNINLQMNYWPSEVCNLAECHEPLFDLIDDLRKSGEKTASVHYGCRGWVAHHMTDLLHQTTPIAGRARYAFWPMAGAWLSRHLWDHYLFSQDTLFLKERGWPVMRGAAEFLLDWLVETPSGELTTSPSTSPENSYVNELGHRCAVCTGSAMDLSIIRDLFSHCLEASHRLGGVDPDVCNRMTQALGKLPPLRIGSKGQIMEWNKDWQEFEPTHRHVSHLYGLHPGEEITPHGTPELAEAARRSLQLRGDSGTGWSLAWKMNLYARLGDGDQSYRFISNLFHRVDPSVTATADAGGGLYPNLLDACPPFQIDGNFGYIAGVAEMLLQSHTGEIHLLPALPSAWPSGSIRGLRARGGTEVALKWSAGKLERVTIKNASDQDVVLRYKDRTLPVSLPAGESVEIQAARFA
jgi:alpha-L-fucosidase 2